MSQIQSSIGLITGIPIEDTVDKLITVASAPRRTLASRNESLSAERVAVDALASLVLGLRASATAFNRASTFDTRQVNSSDPDALSATVLPGAKATPGVYTFTPIQKAGNHQLTSSSLPDLSSGPGAGELRLGFGGHVDRGAALSQLNGGAGVRPGQVRVTDRAGVSATIDLRGARTVDDVLAAFNDNGVASVSLRAEGDRFVLTDESGGSGSLLVKEVGGGTTAAGLGLAGINAAASSATGQDVFSLGSATLLADLNDGAGVRYLDDLTQVADLTVTLADGTSAAVDLSGAKSVGDVLTKLNNHAALTGKLSAAVAADGNRIELADATTGSGTLSVASVGAGTAAEDLGLDGAAVGGVLTGGRLAAGLRDTLVASLNGGRGLDLGAIAVTNRTGGAPTTIDLSTAETLGDVVSLINDAGAGVTASINAARNGIQVTDTTGGTGTLTIANSGPGTTADDLGIAVSAAVSTVGSGSLNKRSVSLGTTLASLNGGNGVRVGNIRVTDSTGASRQITLGGSTNPAKTLGDVVDRINAAPLGVEARINDAGDGLLLTDTAGGSGRLTVADVSGSLAADLRIAGQSASANDAGQQVIDGRGTLVLDLSDLSDVASPSLASLNAGAGVNKGVFRVTDARGNAFGVNLGAAGDEAFTIQDVVDKINAAAQAAGSAVTARVTSTGLTVVDSVPGNGSLKIDDLGAGSAAKDLGLAKTAPAAIAGQQTIESSGLFPSTATQRSAFQELANRINAFNGGVTASVLSDGQGTRLSLAAENTGAANELLVDGGSTGLSFEELSRPRDAVLLFGGGARPVGLASADGGFEDVVEGVRLNVKGDSGEPVTVTVSSDDQPLVKAAQALVDAYNAVQKNLDTVTDFDAEENTTGILFGRNEPVRIEAALGRLASGSFTRGSLGSLEAIGISLDDTGKLTLNSTKLTEAFNDDPAAVEALFTNPRDGIVAKFTTAIDQLAGEENSLLATRSEALTRIIEGNDAKLADLDDFLGRERTRMLNQFYTLESVISNLQNNLSILDNIQFIQAPTSRN